jgi:colicin import membrane protein
LLDKRAPQRQAALGATLNDAPSLGAPTGSAMTLSMNELDALRARLRDCWDVPVGVRDARDLVVTVRIQFKKDGSLTSDPTVVNRSPQPVFQVASESAVRAIRKCAPFSFLPPAKYEAWKDVEVNFDPREMFGG